MNRRTFPQGAIRLIAVDLTPVLPGGENGGAKVFALELVRRLAAIAPGTRFVLLTQAASHEELAALDSHNVSRVLAVGPAASAGRAGVFAAASRVASRLPAWARRRAARVGYAVHAWLKRGTAGLVGRLGADVLFCPFTAPTFHERGVATVCTIYDLQYLRYPQFFSPEDVELRSRAFLDAAARADLLAAISDYTRASAVEAAQLDPSRVATVYMRLADRAADAGGGSEVLTRLGLERGAYLLYPANYWKHKNHELLLAAFGAAVHGGLDPRMKLVCTGAIAARERWLREAARRLGLADRVVFAGFVPDTEVAALIANATAVVYPSLYEGFGLPVIEAMAAGTPVACSRAAALPEAAGEAALLVDARVPGELAEAMLRLARDANLRTRLREAGLKRAEEFRDADRMARDYLALFSRARAGQGA